MALNSTIFVAETEIRVGEGTDIVTERIVRNGSLEDDVRITYGVSGNNATAGDDFVGGFGTVTMPAGEEEVSVPIRLFDDSAAEETEVLVFSLISVEGGTLWAPRTSRISILDDETPAPPPPAEPPLVSDYDVDQVPLVTGLDQPVKFEFSPFDPSLVYVAEKPGTIKVADTDTGAVSTMLDIRGQVNDIQDRGLLDIALHPDFAANPYIYAFAVVDPPETAGLDGNAGPDGGGNRYAQLFRYTADASTGYTTVVPGSETVLLGAAGRSLDDVSGGGRDDFTDPSFAGAVASDRYVNPDAPAQPVVDGFKQDYLKVDSLSHAGGSLAFGQDGALYVAIGDGTSFNYADPRTVDVQELDSLSGKVLRVDPFTGDGLRDNPFADPGVPLDGNRAKVWQSGLRNPFSTAVDDEGRLFLSNTGWNSWEMIDLGGPGANFGWPWFEGGDGGVLLRAPGYRDFGSAGAFYEAVDNGEIEVTPPFRAFSHDSTDPGFQVQGITGGKVVYTGGAYPSDFADDYFFSDFAGGEVYTVDANDRTSLKFLFQGERDSVPIEFVQGPGGYVYYANVAYGEIGRLDIRAAAPPPSGGSATTTIGTGPDTLVLRVSQDYYEGDASYTVLVDGVRIGGLLAATARRGSGAPADTVNVLGDFAAGPHTATIEFVNDAWGGTPDTDRNLYLESAAYNGADVGGASLSFGVAGPQSFGFTDAGGGGGPPPSGGSATVGTGPDSLVLRVTQDAYQGPAQYTVGVDGARIGGVLTAEALRGSGASDTVTVLGDFAAGGHTASVDFLNDAYGGTPETDRNLYVEGAAYNGAEVAGAARTLLGPGPSDFGFTDTGGATPPPPAGGAVATTVGSGPDTLVLRVSQDAYQGAAQYTVSVDGARIGGVLTAGASRASGESDTVTVLGDFAPGGHSVSVDFLNDDYGGSAAADRNLYVDGATYNGAAVDGAARSLFTAGPSGFGFTDTGTATPPPSGGGGATTVGSGSDTLVLRVTQDAYQGPARYTVGVDGVQIGGVLTAQALRGSGDSDAVTVLGSFEPGGHTVTVDFLNDLWDGTPATDRNLYLEGATYNGAAVPGAAAEFLPGGPRSFGITDSTPIA